MTDFPSLSSNTFIHRDRSSLDMLTTSVEDTGTSMTPWLKPCNQGTSFWGAPGLAGHGRHGHASKTGYKWSWDQEANASEKDTSTPWFKPNNPQHNSEPPQHKNSSEAILARLSMAELSLNNSNNTQQQQNKKRNSLNNPKELIPQQPQQTQHAMFGNPFNAKPNNGFAPFQVNLNNTNTPQQRKKQSINNAPQKHNKKAQNAEEVYANIKERQRQRRRRSSSKRKRRQEPKISVRCRTYNFRPVYHQHYHMMNKQLNGPLSGRCQKCQNTILLTQRKNGKYYGHKKELFRH
eukprot:386743_1